MKYLSLLITCLFIVSCGNAQETTSTKAQTPLTGTYKITSVGSNTSIPKDLIIAFNIEKKMVSGYSGCNQFSGSYASEGASLSFGPIAGTRKMCRTAANSLEKHILKALNDTKRYSVENTVFSLFNDKGNILLTLEKPNIRTSKVSESDINQVEYTAASRGFYMMVSYENNSISFQKNRTSKPQVKALTEAEITSLNTKIQAIDLASLKNLEAPSKAHQYDGAAIASLKVIKNGTNYQTPSFDYGNPPKAIESLVSELLALVEKL